VAGSRSVDDLVAVAAPAWPALQQELIEATISLKILPVEWERGCDCLHRLQVTAGSRLGALALHTGGLLVEHGWLRVLGGGEPSRRLWDLAEANGLDTPGAVPPTLLVGFDVLGGRFEVTGGDPAAVSRPGAAGELCYFAPDTLRWEPLGVGHGSWLSWLAQGGTAQFYTSLRWPGWQDDVAQLVADQGLSTYPFLWTAECQADLARASRRAVPITELFGFNGEAASQIDGLADGAEVDVVVDDERSG
jgi:hypothetical protein